MKSLTFNRSALRLSELESRLAPAITLIASGNWDNPEIWQGGIPTNNDDVIISQNLTCSVTNGGEAKSIVVQGLGKLVI